MRRYIRRHWHCGNAAYCARGKVFPGIHQQNSEDVAFRDYILFCKKKATGMTLQTMLRFYIYLRQFVAVTFMKYSLALSHSVRHCHISCCQSGTGIIIRLHCHIHIRQPGIVTFCVVTAVLAQSSQAILRCHIHSRQSGTVTFCVVTAVLAQSSQAILCCHIHQRHSGTVTSITSNLARYCECGAASCCRCCCCCCLHSICRSRK